MKDGFGGEENSNAADEDDGDKKTPLSKIYNFVW